MPTFGRVILIPSLACLTLFAVAGCGKRDEAVPKPTALKETSAPVLAPRTNAPVGPPAVINTILDQSAVTAGASVNVTCEARDDQGTVIPGFTTTITSDPPDGLTIQGLTISTQGSGGYTIACDDAGTGAQVNPAQLTVNPGPAVAIAIALDQYNVRAGTQVAVFCDLRDQYNNPVDGATFTANPQPTSSDPASVTPTVIGDYTLSCTGGGLVSDPVSLHVDPGLPARITITSVTPQQAIYRGGSRVTLTADIVDRFSNAISTGANWRVVGNPTTAIVPSGHAATLLRDGQVQLIAEVTSPTEGGTPVSDNVMVTVDALPPSITFNNLTRGQLVVGRPGAPMNLTGQVTDIGSGVASLVINGGSVAFDSSGAFNMSLTTRWGVNTIQGVAIDGVGNQRQFVQSFELASNYRRANPTSPPANRIGDGIIAHLGQQAFDDGDTDIDDMSTLTRLLIQQANIATLISNPLTSYHSDCSIPFVTIRDDLRLYVDRVTYGTPVVHMSSQNGALRMHIEIPNMVVNIHTNGGVCHIGIGVSGTATANRVTVDGALQISSSGGVFNVSMPRPSVSIAGLSIHINLPSVISWAVDGIISLFTGSISGSVSGAFADSIQQNVPPLIRDFLRSINLGTGFDLPAPLSMRLNFDSVIGRTNFDTNGATLGLDSTIYTTRPAITPEPIGGILQESRTTPAFRPDRGIGVAISYDLANQALYSLWYGGGLNQDITSLASSVLPLPGVTVRLQGLAPPVLGPNSDPAYPVKIQAGDLKIVATFPPTSGLPAIDANIYGTFELNANLTIDATGNFHLALDPNPTIALEVDIPPEALIDGAMLGTVISTSLRSLLPQIVGQVLTGIPLPRLQLSQFISGLPPNIVLGLTSPELGLNGSYLVLQGTLEQLPP